MPNVHLGEQKLRLLNRFLSSCPASSAPNGTITMEAMRRCFASGVSIMGTRFGYETPPIEKGRINNLKSDSQRIIFSHMYTGIGGLLGATLMIVFICFSLFLP
jgi:hypothetical protein